MIYDIEHLFLMASKESLTNDEKKTITSSINANHVIINKSSDEVFTYGEDSHLL